ncbi:hypothetical protein MYOV003v1_p0045 [Vibrio phage 207E48.1]|nr:hypothetical protein MYOV003v1_p0045 [Vibrio phage 207E48.1]
MTTQIKVTVRPFNREDWYGFAGAEGEAQMVDFPEGSSLATAPAALNAFRVTGEESQMYVTIDDNGSYVMWINCGGESVQMFKEGTLEELTKFWSEQLVTVTVGQLIDAGFSLPEAA